MNTPQQLFDLTGKVAVVTGGSRGIGRAVAEGLAAAGADVVVASRKLEACQAAAVAIEAATGRRALPVACHVGRWEDCDRLAETVYDAFGRCDVLVNNAGMSPLYDDLASVTEVLYDKTHAVNARGPFRLSALLGSRMADAEGARSSTSALPDRCAPTPTTCPTPWPRLPSTPSPWGWRVRGHRRSAPTSCCPGPSTPTSPKRGARTSSGRRPP